MTIDEFCKRLDVMAARYPADAETALEKGAKYMTREIRKATPVGKGRHPHKLAKSWRCNMKGYRASDVQAEIRSTAPHFHLVNRGVQNAKTPQGAPMQNPARLNTHVGFFEKAVERNLAEASDRIKNTFYEKVRDHLA